MLSRDRQTNAGVGVLGDKLSDFGFNFDGSAGSKWPLNVEPGNNFFVEEI